MPKKKNAPRVSNSKKTPKSKFKINTSFKNKIIGLILVSAALFMLMFPFSNFLPKAKPAKTSPIVISSKLLKLQQNQNIPVRIIIPKADIDLKVIPAKVVDGYWETSDSSASYGLGSGLPGTKNNTVIFAHARVGLFYNLKDVKIGDFIYVFTKNKWYKYKVNAITAVYPNQIEVIQPTSKETLTLYTCTGFYDEKRLIVTAIPQE